MVHVKRHYACFVVVLFFSRCWSCEATRSSFFGKLAGFWAETSIEDETRVAAPELQEVSRSATERSSERNDGALETLEKIKDVLLAHESDCHTRVRMILSTDFETSLENGSSFMKSAGSAQCSSECTKMKLALALANCVLSHQSQALIRCGVDAINKDTCKLREGCINEPPKRASALERMSHGMSSLVFGVHDNNEDNADSSGHLDGSDFLLSGESREVVFGGEWDKRDEADEGSNSRGHHTAVSRAEASSSRASRDNGASPYKPYPPPARSRARESESPPPAAGTGTGAGAGRAAFNVPTQQSIVFAQSYAHVDALCVWLQSASLMDDSVELARLTRDASAASLRVLHEGNKLGQRHLEVLGELQESVSEVLAVGVETHDSVQSTLGVAHQVLSTTTASAALLQDAASTLDENLRVSNAALGTAHGNRRLLEDAEVKLDAANGKLDESLEYSRVLQSLAERSLKTVLAVTNVLQTAENSAKNLLRVLLALFSLLSALVVVRGPLCWALVGLGWCGRAVRWGVVSTLRCAAAAATLVGPQRQPHQQGTLGESADTSEEDEGQEEDEFARRESMGMQQDEDGWEEDDWRSEPSSSSPLRCSPRFHSPAPIAIAPLPFTPNATHDTALSLSPSPSPAGSSRMTVRVEAATASAGVESGDGHDQASVSESQQQQQQQGTDQRLMEARILQALAQHEARNHSAQRQFREATFQTAFKAARSEYDKALQQWANDAAAATRANDSASKKRLFSDITSEVGRVLSAVTTAHQPTGSLEDDDCVGDDDVNNTKKKKSKQQRRRNSSSSSSSSVATEGCGIMTTTTSTATPTTKGKTTSAPNSRRKSSSSSTEEVAKSAPFSRRKLSPAPTGEASATSKAKRSSSRRNSMTAADSPSSTSAARDRGSGVLVGGSGSGRKRRASMPS